MTAGQQAQQSADVQVAGPLTWDNEHMDPFVRMICQRGAIIGLTVGARVLYYRPRAGRTPVMHAPGPVLQETRCRAL